MLGPGFSEHGNDDDKTGTYYYEAVVWNRSGLVTHHKKSKIENEPGGISGAILCKQDITQESFVIQWLHLILKKTNRKSSAVFLLRPISVFTQ